MEKASETLSSIIFCQRGAKPRRLSELCTPPNVPHLTHNSEETLFNKEMSPTGKMWLPDPQPKSETQQ